MTKLARSLLSLSASACRLHSELDISHTILYSQPMIASESYSPIGIKLRSLIRRGGLNWSKRRNRKPFGLQQYAKTCTFISWNLYYFWLLISPTFACNLFRHLGLQNMQSVFFAKSFYPSVGVPYVCLTVQACLNTQNYGLFCSLNYIENIVHPFAPGNFIENAFWS